MKQLLFFTIICVFVLGCKKDKAEPISEIKTIVGKWRLDAYERTINGQTTWEKVANEPSYLSFRFDGVILDSNGLPACCAPASYNLNGVKFTIVPKADLPENKQCYLVDCIGCPSWDIGQTGDEMVVGICGIAPKAKYLRQL